MSRLRTPIVTVITGEGGSGGALAIAVGDVVIALENAVYSVISPEGCAAILWRTAGRGARPRPLAMRMTAADQQALGVVDIVVPEPGEGAHTDHAETAARLKAIISTELDRSRRPARSTTWSSSATGATGRWARTLRSPTPDGHAAAPSRGLADRLRDLLDPGRGVGAGAPPSGRRDEPPAREEV